MPIAFSVDLEPNKDGTLGGVREAMEWFDEAVPRGTVFATYRIARELPELLALLSENHEIGVHVHPVEFGGDCDQLAELSRSRQRRLIEQTRAAVADAIGVEPATVRSFRAGRHSASETTFDVLSKLGFAVDASVNVRYEDYLPDRIRQVQNAVFLGNGLVEVPTTYVVPKLLSRAGLNVFPHRNVTATAATLRSDSMLDTGVTTLRAVFSDPSVELVSMYMHPYDATEYHEIENGGSTFRERLESILATVDEFRTLGEVTPSSSDRL